MFDEVTPKESGKLTESVDKALCIVECFADAGPMQRFTDELCREKLKDLLEATDRLSRLLGFAKTPVRTPAKA